MSLDDRITWRTWHLVALFGVGSLLERIGERLREWSGDKLKDKWFA